MVSSSYKLPIFVGQVSPGYWFAMSPEIPWLATEGNTFDEVVKTIDRIAPALVSQHGIPLPFSLEWKAIEVFEIGLGGLN